ncbi:MAG TPA: ATP-binding protein [Bryobacteraceae bacterium]|nr:ATP-binding protein [Bryobacteraceae bacterium]
MRIDRYLDSELESADEAETLVVDVARDAGFPEDELHKIGMAVRESIVNAVVHGNRYNRRKKVHLAVSTAGDRLAIRVGDEGEGFDMTSLPDPVADQNLLQQSGRGIFLIRAFMDEFSIRQLNPGTEVTLLKFKG